MALSAPGLWPFFFAELVVGGARRTRAGTVAGGKCSAAAGSRALFFSLHPGGVQGPIPFPQDVAAFPRPYNDFMSVARIVLTTVGSNEAAMNLGRILVSERLAACVNIVDRVESIYRWQGVIHDEKEVLLIIKTVEGQLDSLRERIYAVHPYEVPEYIVLSPADVSTEYLDWLIDSSGPDGENLQQ